jgi:hypothetical protein
MYSRAEFCTQVTKYRTDTIDGAGFGPKTTESDAALNVLSSEMDLAESDTISIERSSYFGEVRISQPVRFLY